METFRISENYCSTIFHQLLHNVHSTGHSERLSRKETTNNYGFRSENYAIEELTAEMGASNFKSYAGIPIEQLESNAAYIQRWLERLKKDKRYIIYASSQAQKATDYILNMRNEEKELGFTDQDELIKESDSRGDELKMIREKNEEKMVIER